MYVHNLTLCVALQVFSDTQLQSANVVRLLGVAEATETEACVSGIGQAHFDQQGDAN